MQNRQIIEAAFRRAGITPNVQVETDSLFVLYAQVRYGGLFGVVPHSLLLPFELREEVTAIRLVPPLTRRTASSPPCTSHGHRCSKPPGIYWIPSLCKSASTP